MTTQIFELSNTASTSLLIDMALIETEDLVNCEIFRYIFLDKVSQKSIAEKYDKSQATISRIYNRCFEKIKDSKFLKELHR